MLGGEGGPSPGHRGGHAHGEGRRPHYSGSSSVKLSHGLMQKPNEAALLKVLCKLLTQHGANNWHLDGFASAVSGGLS